MKRIISFMMALALMLTMSVSAYAAEEKTGSITVTNATIGESYTLYKIFDASPALDEENKPIMSNGQVVISYTMGTNNQFFEDMFGSVDNPVNDYFTYTPIAGENKGNIARKEGVTKEAIQKYLKELIDAAKITEKPYAHTKTLKKDTAEVDIRFENLDYGYYLIDSSMGSLVTLASTTPDVNVIDKNQEPGTGFDKKVYDEDAEEWVDSTTANIGDILKFEIKFEATNYDGENAIKYYTVKDTKGSSLWVEFNEIAIRLEDKDGNIIDELNKGYYHFAPSSSDVVKTNEWTLFGAGWTSDEKAEAELKDTEGDTMHEKFADAADWYLIHRGYDEFDILIPWLDGHDFTGSANGGSITYSGEPTPKNVSPVNVVISYTASVEPSATIGPAQSNTLWNTAKLTWTSVGTDGPSDSQTTDVVTYALGLEKTDSDTQTHLAGAVFELYSEKIVEENGVSKSVLGDKVYVIPTGVKGVYILDDLKTEVSGEKRESAREQYKAYLEAYLGTNYATTQKNVVTTEANGKLVVLGLESGNYYLKEVKAPDGYNLLPEPKLIAVGQTNDTFTIYADANGNVYDEEAATEDHVPHSYTATSVKVPNSRGVELPSTGGEGTMRLITFGTIIAIAFAALLITHKKMTVYVD